MFFPPPFERNHETFRLEEANSKCRGCACVRALAKHDNTISLRMLRLLLLATFPQPRIRILLPPILFKNYYYHSRPTTRASTKPLASPSLPLMFASPHLPPPRLPAPLRASSRLPSPHLAAPRLRSLPLASPRLPSRPHRPPSPPTASTHLI